MPGGEAVDVGLLPVDAVGQRRRDEVGEPDAEHVAGGHVGDRQQHDRAHVGPPSVASSSPCTQNRPVTFGSIVVPEMSLPPCSMISTSISGNGRPGTSERANSVSSRSRSPPMPSASSASTHHDLARRRLDRRHTAEQTPGRPERGDPVEDPVAHLDRPARVDLRRAGLLAEADHRHLRAAALDRTLEAGVRLDPVDGQDAVGGGGVAVEVQRHAGRRAGHLDRLHRRPDRRADRRPRSCRAIRASPR